MTLHRRPRHVLVIANETVADPALHAMIVAHADRTEVVLVAPAGDERAANDRLATALSALDRAGVHVGGWVGAADPLRAIDEALAIFPADELLVVTHPAQRSAWLAQDIVTRACARHALPVVHLVGERTCAPLPA